MTNNNSMITDDYVAGVLAKEATDASLKYSSMGLEAYRAKPTNKLKPNTRFLRHIIKETKSHNEALLAREAADAQTRLDELAAEEDRKRRKFRPDAKDVRKRQLGDISAILAGRQKRKRGDAEPERRKRHASDSRENVSDPIPVPRIRGRGGQRDGHNNFRSDGARSRSPVLERHRDDGSRRTKDSSRKGHRPNPTIDDDRSKRPRSHRCRSSSVSTSEDGERQRHRGSRRHRSRSRSVPRDRERRHHRSHKRRDRSRSRSPAERSRGHRQRSPLTDDDEEGATRSRQSRVSKSGPERQISTPPKSSAAGRSDFGTSDSDSDPLEDLIGPAPPPVRSAVRVRGRGAVASSSGIDGRFSGGYDANLDGEPDEATKGSGDWDEELEAYRDRQKWKQQGAARLREAGFSDDQVKKWEKGGDKDIDDVQWSKKGEKREWDRGKLVGADGAITAKAEWAQ